MGKSLRYSTCIEEKCILSPPHLVQASISSRPSIISRSQCQRASRRVPGSIYFAKPEKAFWSDNVVLTLSLNLTLPKSCP